MKQTLLLAIFALANTALAQPQKLALLVGVGTYPSASGWKSLNSANDLSLLKSVFAKKSFDVYSLQSEQATKQVILDGLSQAETMLQPGDLFHFHFSGHGQQVADLSGDEFDGLDEALVPFDAPARYGNGYEGQQHILDDELGKALQTIRRKLGQRGQLFVTLDACHSGTATRALSTCRGTDIILAAPGFKPKHEQAQDEKMMDETARDATLAPMVVFSASSANQANWEFPAEDGKRYGPLSYALGKVLGSDASPHSYQGFFDKIRAEMAVIAPRQTPRAEGALNLSVGEGLFLYSDKPHYEVIFARNNTEVQINGGLLQQLHPGTKLSLYPPDTWQPENSEPIAKGHIVHSDLIRSDVELSKPTAREKIVFSWVYVEEKALGNAQMAIKIVLPNHPDMAEELKTQLAQLHNVRMVEDNYDLLLEEMSDHQFRVISHDEITLAEESFTSPFADASYLVETVIFKYAQARFLKQLTYEDAWLKVRLKIIPVIQKADKQVEYADSTLGILSFQEGESFYIEVFNEGEKACFLNLLDIQPDFTTTSLLPDESDEFQPEDLMLAPGERRRLKTVNGTEEWFARAPLGLDMLKLIATEEPVDLRRILRTRGASLETNPVALAFARSFSLSTRSDEQTNLPGGAASVVSVMVQVK